MNDLFRQARAKVKMLDEADDYEIDVTVPGDIAPGTQAEAWYFFDMELEPRFKDQDIVEVVPI